MKCISEEKLWEYLDNEMDAATEQQTEAHLAECPHCQTEMQQLLFLNAQFENAIKAEATKTKSKNCLIEIELGYNEIKPLLKRFWKQIAAFGVATTFVTILFITLVCPVSNKPIFEPQFHTITYSISQFLYFMTKPIIMNLWVIVLTFSFLFWLDKTWLRLTSRV